METKLTGTHQRTYESLFQHPVSRNLEWRELRAMFDALADVTDEPNGNMKVKRNGHTLILHPPTRKDFSDVQELMKIRHFLENSGDAPRAAAAGGSNGAHMLVVIDHREARIYKTELHGTVPRKITPYDPEGTDRHLHYVQDDSNGQRKPERKSFYEAVARTLKDAERVLVFGSGTGASSAMVQLKSDLQEHHRDTAARVVGWVIVDEQHLTENQLLAKAREFYAKSA
jgi:hypothetical protein